MLPMAKGTSALIPLTSEEKDLLKVAVRLACAIQYWDKHSERIKEDERENWFHDGIADEMVRMLLPLCFHSEVILFAYSKV